MSSIRTRSRSASPVASPATSGPTCCCPIPSGWRASSTDRERPVQIIVAGKAHRDDEEGKRLVQAWAAFVQQARRSATAPSSWRTTTCPGPGAGAGRRRVDQHAAPALGGLRHQRDEGAGQRRPEPVGAGRLVGRGVPPEVGWALGDGQEHATSPNGMRPKHSNCIRFSKIRSFPSSTAGDEAALPRKWIQRVRQSMARLTPRFSGNRMVRELRETIYYREAAPLRAGRDPAVAWRGLVALEPKTGGELEGRALWRSSRAGAEEGRQYSTCSSTWQTLTLIPSTSNCTPTNWE